MSSLVPDVVEEFLAVDSAALETLVVAVVSQGVPKSVAAVILVVDSPGQTAVLAAAYSAEV